MSFDDVLGQKAAKRIIKDELNAGRISHAYLFLGRSGLGKRKLALEFVKALLCQNEGLDSCDQCVVCRKIEHGNHADVRFLIREEESSKIKIDQIRELQQEIIYKPYESEKKIFVIDESDYMTQQAANSLLRTLEEPPEYAVIILLAEEINQLLPTIISRCQQVNLHPVNRKKIKDNLLSRGLNEKEAALYSKLAGGSPGMAQDLAEDDQFREMRDKLYQFLIDLEQQSIVSVFKQVNKLEKYLQHNQQLLDLISSWYRDIILCIEGNTKQIVNIDYLEQIKQSADEFQIKDLYQKINYVNKIKNYMARNTNKALSLQVLFLKLRSGRM